MEKNYNLQVLRGIACIFVCLNHFTFFNKYGFGSAGVEVFLILSGYLTIFNYYKKGGNLSDHYLKRKFITILPMYWILTVLVYIVGLIIPSIFNTLDFSFKNLIYSLLLIPGKTPFIPPGWTLTYIFYFYIIVYLCNSCFKQIRLETKITIWIVLAIIVSFIIHNEFVISLNSPIMIEFVYGFILYRIKDLKFTSNNKIITSFISIMLVLIFFFPGLRLFFQNTILDCRFIIQALITTVLIKGFLDVDLSGLKSSHLKMIGDISFTIYLAHVLIIRPFDKIARIFKIDTSFVMLLMIPICLFFVVIICKYIDLINKKICIYLNRINMVG